MPAFGSPHFPFWLLELFSALFLAILFLQSGLDKVFDWTGNHRYITGYFQKTRLGPTAPLMLGVITLMEVGAGALSALGVLQLLIQGTAHFAFWGAALGTLSFLCLFFGQRIAKDYAAAAGMAPYFLVGLAAMYLTGRF